MQRKLPHLSKDKDLIGRFLGTQGHKIRHNLVIYHSILNSAQTDVSPY